MTFPLSRWAEGIRSVFLHITMTAPLNRRCRCPQGGALNQSPWALTAIEIHVGETIRSYHHSAGLRRQLMRPTAC